MGVALVQVRSGGHFSFGQGRLVAVVRGTIAVVGSLGMRLNSLRSQRSKRKFAESLGTAVGRASQVLSGGLRVKRLKVRFDL